MKRIACAVVAAALLAPATVAAQAEMEIPPEFMEVIQKDVATLRMDVMQSTIQLKAGEAATFWAIYEEYLAALAEASQKLSIGNGLENPAVDLGPMLNQAGIDKATSHIEDALEKGARLLCGGKHPEGPEYQTKLYYQPTALADCTLDMLVMRDETFGPVVGIAPFQDVEDAIRLANSTDFGLVSYAYTSSLANARALSRGIKSGTVCINNIVGSTLEAPYPGWKHSGMGLELSRHALDEYLLVKHVRIEI